MIRPNPIDLTVTTVVEPFIIKDINFKQTDESTIVKSSNLPSVPETRPSSSKSKGKQLKKSKSAVPEKREEEEAGLRENQEKN